MVADDGEGLLVGDRNGDSADDGEQRAALVAVAEPCNEVIEDGGEVYVDGLGNVIDQLRSEAALVLDPQSSEPVGLPLSALQLVDEGAYAAVCNEPVDPEAVES